MQETETNRSGRGASPQLFEPFTERKNNPMKRAVTGQHVAFGYLFRPPLLLDRDRRVLRACTQSFKTFNIQREGLRGFAV